MKYLGIVLLVLSGNVMAGEVYYCSDNYANGIQKKDRQYKPVNFILGKFKMKIQEDGNIAIGYPMSDEKALYLCSTPYNNLFPEWGLRAMKSCVHEYNNGNFFNFNPGNGRYIRHKSNGYVFNDGEDVMTRIGTCTKF